MDDAYNALNNCKLPDESFSDTVRRITAKSKTMENFFGIWEDVDTGSIKKTIAEKRAYSRKRQAWREKRLSA